MNAWLKTCLPGALALAFLVSPTAIRAEESMWLPAGSATAFAGPPPKEILQKGAKLQGQTLLGKLLFNSPSLLGEKAVRIGLSCNSCHPNGHVNTSFYISGLSGEPGTIDLSNRFWRKGTEDGLFNPVPIPSLRNVSKTAPYGSNTVLPTLSAFTRHVISDEFGGPPPSEATLNALLHYMNLLENETGSDLSIQGQAAPVLDLIALLAEPLLAQNIGMLEARLLLIKEELGRRVTDSNRRQLEKLVLRLKTIRHMSVDAPDAAQAAYDKLVSEAALY